MGLGMLAITKRDVLIGALLALLAAGTVLLVREVLLKADRYLVVDSPYAVFLVPLRWTAVTAALVVLVAVAVRWRPRTRPVTGGLGVALRGVLYVFLLAFAASSIAHAWGGFQFSSLGIRSIFFSMALFGLSVWTLLLVLAPGWLGRHPLVRGCDVILLNLVLILLAAEIVVTLAARFLPSRVLWDEDSIVSLIEANRLPPGTPLFGFPANSAGYHDRDFFPARADDVVVALLSDSFGLGVVPYRYNFATVAEQGLNRELAAPGRRVAVHNFGIGSLDMTGYAWLLEHEVPAVKPTLVLLAVFVGNDIAGFKRRKNRYYCLQYTRFYGLLRRLIALGGEARRGARLLDAEPAEPIEPPYLHDPALEPARMSEETFLAIESERFEKCNTRDAKIQRHYQAFFEALDFFQHRLGERLAVVIIPDEYQVNDALYAELMRRVPDDPAVYDREYPQQRILTHCRERGIAVLDLLEVLRQGQRDGRVYHLRDTHWNARGNHIAGEAIAHFLVMQLARLAGTDHGGRKSADRDAPQPQR